MLSWFVQLDWLIGFGWIYMRVMQPRRSLYISNGVDEPGERGDIHTAFQ